MKFFAESAISVIIAWRKTSGIISACRKHPDLYFTLKNFISAIIISIPNLLSEEISRKQSKVSTEFNFGLG